MILSNYFNSKISSIFNRIFSSYPNVNEVILFGSRAKGTHTDRSDIDLAIQNSNIDRHTLGKIKFEIDNSDIPYIVDLVVLEDLVNLSLLANVKREGKIIYTRN